MALWVGSHLGVSGEWLRHMPGASVAAPGEVGFTMYWGGWADLSSPLHLVASLCLESCPQGNLAIANTFTKHKNRMYLAESGARPDAVSVRGILSPECHIVNP